MTQWELLLPARAPPFWRPEQLPGPLVWETGWGARAPAFGLGGHGMKRPAGAGGRRTARVCFLRLLPLLRAEQPATQGKSTDTSTRTCRKPGLQIWLGKPQLVVHALQKIQGLGPRPELTGEHSKRHGRTECEYPSLE